MARKQKKERGEYLCGGMYEKFVPADIPCKENSLYLVIRQAEFDKIISGEKTEEYREIKDSTYSKYLKCDIDDYPYVYTDKIGEDDPLLGEIFIWNNGVYPYVPKEEIRFLRLAAGYNKNRDTAIVEVSAITFEPEISPKTGKEARFHEVPETGEWIPDENGELCMWLAVFHLGKIVELNRKK